MDNEPIVMDNLGNKPQENNDGEKKIKKNKKDKKKKAGCCGKTDSRNKPERKIFFNNPERNKQDKNFCTNYVRTAKYNVISFLPLFLFDQFTRVANVFFLIMSILQLIPGLSPTGRFTTLITLIFVLFVNGIKEVFEDLKRHRGDREINTKKVKVVRGGELVSIEWQNVVVGDIVYLVDKDFIPADLIVISTSEKNSSAYIETMSMDGETNLKHRQGLTVTKDLKDLKDIANWKGSIIAGTPTEKIYSFVGSLSYNGSGDDKVGLKEDNMLIRGASVRNTQWVYAAVVYTGEDTKLRLNASASPFKRSNVEKNLNKYIFSVFVLLFIVCFAATLGSGLWMRLYPSKDAWYLMITDSIVKLSLLNFITFIILFNNMVPISLYVTMELVKVWQAFYINNDLLLYYEEKDTPAIVRSASLTEELGQIQYVFSDKTGTLTRNQMQFRKCSIGGIKYGKGYTEISLAQAQRNKEEIDNSLLVDESTLDDKFVNFNDETFTQNIKNKDDPKWHYMDDYFKCLSLCHTVIPDLEKREGKFDFFYNSPSPDEAALIRFARYAGYELVERTPETMKIKIDGQIYVYTIYAVLEFTSARQRMSVIVQEPEELGGRVRLYCKGADSKVATMLDEKGRELEKETFVHLESMGSEGLRTLVVAEKTLDKNEFEEWYKKWKELDNITDVNEYKKVSENLAGLMENGLYLVGATALEDKLQIGVPDAIKSLLKAGINTWVLTGDKLETAINIGFACDLLSNDMTQIVLSIKINDENGNPRKDIELVEECRNKLKENLETYKEIKEANDELALIVTGEMLTYALMDDTNRDMLELLSRKCQSVICCRVSPKQKRLVVNMVKEKQSCISLAIGDGANDVPMIQAAHVGVGINGEEGAQAAMSADFAVGQFRFLVPLLLIHGRYSYRRITKLIMYSFYKNIILVLTQFWFVLFNGFSGQSLYEDWTLAMYNILFTAMPIITFAILDEDVGKQNVMQNPQLYEDGQKNILFTPLSFLGWIFTAIYQSAIIFFLVYYTFANSNVFFNGQEAGLFEMGLVVFICILMTVTFKIALESKRWVWFHHLVVWLSLFMIFLWCIVYCAVYPATALGYNIYFVYYRLLGNPQHWFLVIVVPIACNLIPFTYQYIQRTFFPKNYHIVAEREKLGKLSKLHRQKKPVQRRHLTIKGERVPKMERGYTGYAFTEGLPVKTLNYDLKENEK